MPSPIETVESFLAECAPSKESMVAAFRRYFTPATVWENVGLVTTTGVDEALGLMAQFESSIGMSSMRAETLAISAQGNKVLTERIDYLLRADGSESLAIRLMGVFEIEDDHIVAWRDYFDTASVNGG